MSIGGNLRQSRPKGQGRTISWRQDAFTLIELLVVIGIIGILAALVIGFGPGVIKSRNEKRARAELAKLVTEIDRYKAAFNQYPPDNPNTNAPNQLFYELMGTVHYPATSVFKTKNDQETITYAGVSNYFGVGGFLNTHEVPSQVKSFLVNIRESQIATISSNPEVKILIGPIRGGTNELTDVNGKKVNPWRYNSSNPVHNPGKFDLWIEQRVGESNGVPMVEAIGNW